MTNLPIYQYISNNQNTMPHNYVQIDVHVFFFHMPKIIKIKQRKQRVIFMDLTSYSVHSLTHFVFAFSVSVTKGFTNSPSYIIMKIYTSYNKAKKFLSSCHVPPRSGQEQSGKRGLTIADLSLLQSLSAAGETSCFLPIES